MTTFKKNLLVALVLQVFLVTQAQAKDINLDIKWSDVRFFVSDTTLANPSSQLQTLAQADGIPDLTKLTGFGLEIIGQLAPRIKIGAKFRGVLFGTNKKDASAIPTSYYQVQQYTAGPTVRGLIIDTDSFFWDLYAEVGTANNTVQLSTALGKGEWSKSGDIYTRAGSALGIGGQSAKLLIEAGYESIKMSGAEYQGTVGSQVKEIDLSGPYVAVGLSISGLPSWIKPTK